MDPRKNIAWALVTCTALLALLMAMLPTASGQSMTGQISGTVIDPQSAVVPGATVTLTNALTDQKREVESGAQGAFVFTQLLAGTYEVSVSASGFKVYEQKGIKLSANEKMALRPVQLEIGTTSETVEVTADVARVQTQTSERTGLISTTQVQELAASPNRNFITLLKVIPGVVVPSDQGVTDTGGPPGLQYEVLGGRSGQTVVTLDGVVDADTTMNASTSGYVNPNVDAISEMKVMLTNYTAEYGIRSGGTINVSIKNGTKEFHGSGYYFKRHEKLNANEWNNNRNNQPKSRYRYDNFGGTIGGPILIPGTSFNKNRDKLFFFVSLEWLRNVSPSNAQRRRFPTELERKGDFSQTVDRSGAVYPVYKPGTKEQWPGNVIPESYGDALGKAFLDFYPMPNRTDWSDGDNSYNWIGNWLTENPRNEQIFRIDWNVAPKTLIYTRYVTTANPTKSPMPREVIDAGFPVLGADQNLHSLGLVTTWIQTFSPSLVNEATVGFNKGYQDATAWEDQLPGVQRQNIPGIAEFEQFHPEINPMDILPSALFGGAMAGPGAPPGGGGGGNSLIPNIQVADRFLMHGDNTLWNITDNLSWVKGKHSLKFGFYAELTSRNSVRESNRPGAFDFSSDPTGVFSLDTGLPMANAFIGSVKTYKESDSEQWSQARYRNIEFYAQDSWRATRRLTIDIGARFQNMAPTWFKDGKMGMFETSRYDPNTAMQFIYETTGGKGKDPCNGGKIVSGTLIGSFCMPEGVTYTPEQMFPAVGVFDEKYMNNPGFQISPRFGFAYDVFGDGKMAIRGGFGMFFERSGGDEFQANYLQVPPVQNLATIYNVTVPQLKTATFTYGPSSGVYAVQGSQRDFSEPGSYNWSLGIQRDVGLGFVLDVSYVGTVGRHMRRGKGINTLPYGTHFQSSAINPDTGRLKQDNELRLYRGYGTINYISFDDSSNYHSMQTSINRRFGTRLTIGGFWTWSKAMDYGQGAPGPGASGNPDFMPDSLYYGRASGDHTHNVMVNFTYMVPGLSSHMGNNGFARQVFDGWQLSGITSMVSGAPQGVNFMLVPPNIDMTGSDGAPTRISLVGNPIVSNPEGIQSRLNGDAIALPPYGPGVCQYGDPFTCGFGNATRDVFRGPGVNNWDISVFKNFQLGSNEARSLQFRWETYNTFNHTQYNNVDAMAMFNPAGVQINNTLGQYNNASAARKMVLALKLKF
jgi:hypothetical protein